MLIFVPLENIFMNFISLIPISSMLIRFTFGDKQMENQKNEVTSSHIANSIARSPSKSY